jgi:hypothetical protein
MTDREDLIELIAAPGIARHTIRAALLTSAGASIHRAAIEATRARKQLLLPGSLSPRLRPIRRGKGPRKKYSVHPRARSA